MYMTTALQDDFQIGCINTGFQKLLKNPYSKYGYSRNYFTIMSRHYQKKGILKLGLVTTGNLHKLDHFNVPQTIKEMLKSAGDLTTALGLINGMLIDEIYVYGLACQYKNQSANLLKMNLNFSDNKARTVITYDKIDMHEALMWLLNT